MNQQLYHVNLKLSFKFVLTDRWQVKFNPSKCEAMRISHNKDKSCTRYQISGSELCRALCSVDCFHILEHASTSFQIIIKEAIHIQIKQPSLNQQLYHVNLKLSS